MRWGSSVECGEMSTVAPTLLVLAAGMGSRYGGLKQFEPMGPSGETILDYSVFDALRAGFGRVVFVIRKEFAEAFRDVVGQRYCGRIKVDYVFQDLLDVPDGFRVPQGRVRPWGTLHAVLAARDAVHEPFAVVNADDFYGEDAFRRIATHFNQPAAPGTDVDHYCMVGYPIRQTLSASGGVNRGVCVERGGLLATVEEHTGIVAGGGEVCSGVNLAGDRVEIQDSAVASMNFWGFTPAIFPQMARYFSAFLREHGGDPAAECYIPSVVDHLIRSGEADCRILRTDSVWFGITYPQDKPESAQRIRQLVAAGVYREKLWE